MKVALFFLKLAMSLTCNSIDGLDESCQGISVYVTYDIFQKLKRFQIAFRKFYSDAIRILNRLRIDLLLKENFIFIVDFSLQSSWPPKYKSDERHIKCLPRDPM